jgi:hypothetical protein
LKYDSSRQALYYPEQKPVFVDVEQVRPFQPDNLDFTPGNAWWLSNAAHLAYYDVEGIERELQRVGLRLVQFFSQDSTQAFLAAADNFAILAFRGTECDQLADLLTDADFFLDPFPRGGEVHQGFLKAINLVWDEINGELEVLGLPVWYTGHSLGAALATLAAAYREPAALYTFGSPRVGDAEFVQLLDNVRVYRAVDCSDMAANLPPRIKYRHVGAQHFITSGGKLLLNPSSSSISWHKLVGEARYAATLPWLRRGMVWSRPFADHAIVNYTAAFYHLS